jgi:hypothetical protein
MVLIWRASQTIESWYRKAQNAPLSGGRSPSAMELSSGLNHFSAAVQSRLLRSCPRISRRFVVPFYWFFAVALVSSLGRFLCYFIESRNWNKISSELVRRISPWEGYSISSVA